MHKFIHKVHTKARKNPKRIVFPEGKEERILRAIEEILKLKIAEPILIGFPGTIKAKAERLKLEIDWKKVEIHNPKTSKFTTEFAEIFYKLRKHKEIRRAEAKKIVQDANYFGTMMVHLNYADGMVTGTVHPTSDSIRPALQIIKTKEKFHKVSGVFFMIFEKRLLLFADTAVTIEPKPKDLMNIAIDTAITAKKFGIKPKIALLSFSTKGSANHPLVNKTQKATNMLKYKRPDLVVDGEMQVDAALIPEVAKRKCPKSPIQGDANILIFPDLEAANIAYKLVERLAKAKAVGPLLQGLKKPINDISRGCNYKDIVNIAAFTAWQCIED